MPLLPRKHHLWGRLDQLTYAHSSDGNEFRTIVLSLVLSAPHDVPGSVLNRVDAAIFFIESGDIMVSVKA